MGYSEVWENIRSPSAGVPMEILVVDPDDSSAGLLSQTLEESDFVRSVRRVQSLDEAKSVLKNVEINTIYIDPLLLGLDKASDFIFEMRHGFPTIVFVLYLNLNQVEKIGDQFYKGARKRFKHYYQLDKLTPVTTFANATKRTITGVQRDLLSLEFKGLLKNTLSEKKKIAKTVVDIKRDAASIQVEELREKIKAKIERLETQVEKSDKKMEEQINKIKILIGTSEKFIDWKILVTDVDKLTKDHVSQDLFRGEINTLNAHIKALSDIKTAYDKVLAQQNSFMKQQAEVMKQQSSFINWIKYATILVPIAVVSVPLIEVLLRHFLGIP